MITGNWTWSGFGKSVLVGAVTGAISGGFNATYTATGFNGAVVMGSIGGGIAGGVEALISGQNFATGFYRCGLSGAAMGAVGYTISYFANGGKKSYDVITNDLEVDNSTTVDPDLSKITENIKNARTNRPNVEQYNVTFEGVGLSNSDGYMVGR